MQIFLSDYAKLGHHQPYFSMLNEGVEGTVDLRKITGFSTNRIKSILERRRFLLKILREALQKSEGETAILHFLYIDNLYTLPIPGPLERDGLRIIGTLHQVPEDGLKLFLLKRFAKKVSRLVVHTDYLKARLAQAGIMNVVTIEYPSIYDYSTVGSKEEVREKLGFPRNRVVLSALGGTRQKKGLDILLESFGHMDQKTKDRILLNIVGAERFFKEDYIQGKIREHGIYARVELSYVEEQTFKENVIASDLMVFPYRRSFTGSSGPMAEAMANGIFVIGPNQGNLAHLMEGCAKKASFISEDAKDLARVIMETVKIENRNDDGAKPNGAGTNRAEFVEGHLKLYELVAGSR